MNERDIFTEALAIPDPAERHAFLCRVCGNNPVLQQRIERLLRATARTDSLLDVPVALQFIQDRDQNPTPNSLAEEQTSSEIAEEETFEFLGPPKRPDSLGTLGNYSILQVLGRGGFAIVFKAIDEVLDRVVAIKVLTNALTTFQIRKRFIREARAAAAVRHDNVVQLYSVEEQPVLFLVIEYIPGETLQQRLARCGVLDTQEVLRFGRQIAQGLAAAHQNGFIHRDIKPGNILIDPGPPLLAKITDFGLARSASTDEPITQSGLISGTPMYMSPEQIQGEPVDHRSDLFSLGSVLYALCTGRSPFAAPSPLLILRKVIQENPAPIREIAPHVPSWLSDIIFKLLKKNPVDRYQTASEVVDALTPKETAVLGIPPEGPSSLPNRDASASSDSNELDTSVTVNSEQAFDPKKLLQPLAPSKKLQWIMFGLFGLLLLGGGLGITEATGVTLFREELRRLVFGEGLLVVQVEDPQLTISVEEANVYAMGAGTREFKILAGEYKLLSKKDGVLVREYAVVVPRNGTAMVQIPVEKQNVSLSEVTPVVPVISEGTPNVKPKRIYDPTPKPDSLAPVDQDDRPVVNFLRSLGKVRLMVVDSFGGMRNLEHEQPLFNFSIRIVGISFQGEEFEKFGDELADKLAEPLKKVSLRQVHLPGGEKFTSEGLRKLIALPAFESLYFVAIPKSKVDDSIFLHMTELPYLKDFSVTECSKVTGKGISVLKVCPNLELLSFLESPISPEAVAELNQLSNLKYINLSNSSFSEKHAVALNCSKLETLLIPRCNVNDAVIPHLAKLPKLKKLQISYNLVTELILPELKKFPKLQELDIARTQISSQGAMEFRMALPRCFIIWE